MQEKVKVKSLSRVRLFATPWTVADQAPRSMGFSRQEYWSGLPFPSPGDLPNPGIEPGSPALQTDALLSEPQCRRPQFDSWVRKIPWRREQLLTPIFWPGDFHGLYRLPTPVFLGFPGGSAGKEPTCNAGDLGLIPGLGRSPGEGSGYPLQYSGLERIPWTV